MNIEAIDGLIPAALWKRFYEISQIPRASKNEERVRLYIRNFAGSNNLEMVEDKVGNIVIKLPPAPGFENAETIVLQSHIDMVCEKNKETTHDFTKDPIKLVKKGEWMYADGTTLGADNGIGVAAQLAIAADEDFEHGPIELLFTVDEETGLTGANNLQKGFVTGKYLLNLDTEEDGCFYIGCAGGMDTLGILNIEWADIKSGHEPFSLFISGLKGGHSGININDKRGNAIKMLAYLLNKLTTFDFQIGSLSGGSKRNAIPREAEVLIYLNPTDEAKVREKINEFFLETIIEYKITDENLKITFDKSNDSSKKVFSNSFSKKIIDALLALPHGAVAMHPTLVGLVETSTNLATLVMDEHTVSIGTSQRSSIESAKRNIHSSVKSVFELVGAELKIGDGYPGWQPNLKSNLLKTSKQVYKKLFGADPKIKAVHAGLECGILGEKYPQLDMISLGPTIEGAHSPDEKVNINDVDKFYRLLKSIIVELAKNKI